MAVTEKVICVVGPTATGKTKMGVALAQRFDGEVVSVDSMQIYRGMAVGTAAPTAEEMEGVPHHMIGVADPWENWSAARFTQAADACVQDILRRGRRPILVGGTGLYLDALLRGIDFAAGSQDTANYGSGCGRRVRRRCWRSCGASTRTAPHGCTCGMRSASCGHWRSIRRQGRPSPSTTAAHGSSRPGTRGCSSG